MSKRTTAQDGVSASLCMQETTLHKPYILQEQGTCDSMEQGPAAAACQVAIRQQPAWEQAEHIAQEHALKCMTIDTRTWTCYHCPFAPRDALKIPQRAQTWPVWLLLPAAVLLHLDGAWHSHMCIWYPQALGDLTVPCDAAVDAYGLQIWLECQHSCNVTRCVLPVIHETRVR